MATLTSEQIAKIQSQSQSLIAAAKAKAAATKAASSSSAQTGTSGSAATNYYTQAAKAAGNAASTNYYTQAAKAAGNAASTNYYTQAAKAAVNAATQAASTATSGVDMNTDYAAKINEAVAANDWESAAKYEALRNEKIAAMNASGANTEGYTDGYYAQAVQDKYGDRDYAAQMKENWADVSTNMKLDKERNNKIDAYASAGLDTSGWEKDYYYNWLNAYVNAAAGNSGQTVSLVDSNGNKTNGITSGYSNGATSGYSSKDYSNYYAEALSKLEGLYSSAYSRAEEAYKNALAAANSDLETNKNSINGDYDDLEKQHYIDRELAYKNLPQRLAALGYTGGLSESSLLGIGYDYENNLNSAEKGRSEQLQQAQNYYEQALREAAQTKSDAQSSADWNYYNYYAQAMADQLNAEQWQQSFDYNAYRDSVSDNQWQQSFDYNASRDEVSDSQWAQQWAYQQAQDALDREESAKETAQETALTTVKSLINMGLVPTTAQLMQAYGLTQEEAEAYRSTLTASSDTSTAGYYSAASSSASSGDTASTTSGSGASSTLTTEEWSALANRCNNLKNAGNTNGVLALIESNAASLTTSQMNILCRMAGMTAEQIRLLEQGYSADEIKAMNG